MKQDTITGKNHGENFCYYYLHENGELIHKSKHADPADFEESTFVKKWWVIDLDNRFDGYNLIIVATLLGALKRSVAAMVQKWEMNDQDCAVYCDRAGLVYFMEGSTWCVRGRDFVNLQESAAGFGPSMLDAVIEFYRHEVNA